MLTNFDVLFSHVSIRTVPQAILGDSPIESMLTQSFHGMFMFYVEAHITDGTCFVFT